MTFNIARQPLVPAFLTLAALAALAMWKAGGGGMPAPLQAAIPTEGILAIPSPEELINRFQSANPGWARWIGGFLMLFTGMSLGRLTLRYNLYSVGTCLSIPLYGALVAGLTVGAPFLGTLAATTLLTLAVKNYCRSFRNGYGFDPLFRASLYLGILPLVLPASLPLVAILPLAVVLFHRTLREVVVALTGLLLPILTFCYVNWGAGGDFLMPLTLAVEAFTHGSPLEAVRAIPLPNAVLGGGILLLDLLATFYFLADSYAAGNKPRAIFTFQIFLLVLGIPVLLNPAATVQCIAFIAVPSALITPFLFVRIHRLPALILYLLLLGGCVVTFFIQ